MSGEKFDIGLVRQKMESQGMDGSELARRILVSKQTVSQWLNGETSPSIRNLLAISEVLNCRVSEFFR